MITAGILLTIGIIDLVRAIDQQALRRIVLVLALLGVPLMLALGLGQQWWSAGLAAVLAALWCLAMPNSEVFARRRVWPVVTLGIIVIVTTLLDASSVPANGPLGVVLTDALQAAQMRFSAEVVVAVVASAVFLTRSSNLIAKAALGRAGRHERTRTPDRDASRLRLFGRTVGSVEPVEHAPSLEAPLRGGRAIGALERILIVGLALAGQPALIAGLLAAKGIVRYPEISADRGLGAKAEEFLIGSLTSWSLAGAVVVYLFALQLA
ncbi:hypothetical protein [Humidisolicoccus flavus]|uniref:hypothetical protein n=1 Tax=Humidisolicoccus flavus TaxID=3111414 RepID=UPI003254DD0A